MLQLEEESPDLSLSMGEKKNSRFKPKKKPHFYSAKYFHLAKHKFYLIHDISKGGYHYLFS